MSAKFKLLPADAEHIVRWTFNVPVPVDEGVHNQAFTAQFLVMPQSDIDDVLGSPSQIMSGDEKPELNLLRKVLVGWDGLQQEGIDGAVPFSPQRRDDLLNITYFRSAAAKAYIELLNGRRAKN